MEIREDCPRRTGVCILESFFVTLGVWATVSLGYWAIVSLGDWDFLSLGDWAIVFMGDWAFGTLELN